MASRNNTNHKTAFTPVKPTNPRNRQMDHKRKFSAVPEMSPEARRAILLSREDTKTNSVNSNKKKDTPTSDIQYHDTSTSCGVDTNNNTNGSSARGKGEVTRGGRSVRTSQPSRNIQISSNQTSKLSSSRPPRVPYTGRSRSRSTLSQNEPPFSMSDNNEISSHFGTNTTSNASVYTSNLSSGNNNNNNNNHNNGNSNFLSATNILADTGPNDDDPDDDNDSALPNDDSFDDEEEDEEEEEETAFNKNSFVNALDKALENNDVSRLKGDITDTTRVSKPGTVRALNGGRLTNAQEVVVNVCYDDDKELVFHDDDDESIDTAKAISQIRVNIWMEYNSRFPPDNNLHDFDAQSTDNNEPKRESVSKQRRPSVTTATPREKSHLVPNHRQPGVSTSSRRASNDGGAMKSIAPNQNNAGSSMKRTASNSRVLNVTPSPTPSRRSSGTSSRGKVNSINSSTAKPSTPLRTRR